MLLPHLHGRPLTLKRYPDGVEGAFFYEKNCPLYRPQWVRTQPVWSEHNEREIQFCIADDLPTLVWVINLASLELHTSLSLGHDVQTPTMVVFDLDPGEPATILECGQVALWLRALFEHWKLRAFLKTSGSKGLQVYVPLNTPVTYDKTKGFARYVAEFLERQHPQSVVSKMKKALRRGKIFIDWSQNDEHKTTVCVYSLRAKSRPTVSAPVTWAEVEKAVQRKDAQALTFEASAVLERVKGTGDLFAPVLTLQQALPQIH